MYKGHFITFEGGEGAGKTSVLDQLEKALKKGGYEVMRTREPGGIPISEKIRTIILDVNHTEMDSRTEALLYAAARRQHLIEKVIPALSEGSIVLCDRFIDSSLVYQGHARGLGFNEVKTINEFAIAGYMPNLTLFFDVDPEVGLNRIQKDDKREWNRLDQEKIEFHKLVREGYHILLDSEPNRIKRVDANEPMDSVYDQVIEEVQLYLTTNS